MKRRPDSYVSNGIFYCCITYSSYVSVNDLYNEIKKSFFEKVNSLENESAEPRDYFFGEDSDYQSKWIDNNEISFAKVFDLGDITGKSVSISGSEPEDMINDDDGDDDGGDDDDDDFCREEGVFCFTINSNDRKLYNNSFNSKGLFRGKLQQKRINLNYEKALLLSIDGVYRKQISSLAGRDMRGVRKFYSTR
jgi:hypothetical protein